MLILSKIISKEWFKALFSSLVVLFILITIGDIVNGFLRNYSAQRVILEYFLKLPELMGKVLPISALISTLFAINKLKAQSELMAILAAGFSAKKFYSIIGICSMSIGLLQFLNLGYLQPFANKIKRKEFEKSKKNESKYLARSNIGSQGLMWYKTDEYFTSFSAFDNKKLSLKDVTFYYYNNKNVVTNIFKGEAADFVDNTWLLKNAKVFSNLDNAEFQSFEFKDSFPLTIQEKPSDFNQFESDITTLNFVNLAKFIKRLNMTGINTSEYQIMLFEKISLSLICIIFALIPAQGVFNPNRRSSSFGKNIIFTLTFSIMFWILYTSLVSQGSNGNLNPIFATMIIPAITSFYVAVTYLKNRVL